MALRPKTFWFIATILVCRTGGFGQSKEKAVGISGTETPAAHQKTKQYECFAYRKYVIFTKQSTDGVGEDVRVAVANPSAAAAQACDLKTAKTHYLINNDDSNFFFG